MGDNTKEKTASENAECVYCSTTEYTEVVCDPCHEKVEKEARAEAYAEGFADAQTRAEELISGLETDAGNALYEIRKIRPDV
jgi:hypothetical protein